MTLISDYAEAVSLPKAVKRQRLCQYAGVFCAFCPDVERLPCVLAGGLHDCETCTLPDCACMIGWTKERRAAHANWQKLRQHAEAVRRKRSNLYRPRRWREDRHRHKLGRTCAHPDCDAEIMDANKSGFCRKHSPRRKTGQVVRQAQDHPWRGT